MGNSAILKQTASFILTNAASGIVSTAASNIFQKGIDAALGGSDTDEIKNKIDGVMNEVLKVKEAVTALSKQLDQALLQLRNDTLLGQLSIIDTDFENVKNCINTALQYAKENHAPEERKQFTANLQKNLDDYLNESRKNIPFALNRVNDFLGDEKENSFVRQAANQALKDSSDILSFYGRMKILFMHYWSFSIKGIALMQMAYLSKSIGWGEGQGTINYYTDQMKAQERLLRSVMGDNTCRLAELIITTKDWERPVRIRSGWDTNIDFYGASKHGTWYDQPAATGDGDTQWRIDPGWNQWDGNHREERFIWFEDWSPFGNIKMFITTIRPRDRMFLQDTNNDPDVGYMLMDKEGVKTTYLIKPVAVGSDRYRITTEPDKNYLFVSWEHNKLAIREKLEDPNSDRWYWKITPWDK